MDYSFYLSKYIPNYKKLINFGFILFGNDLIYRQDLKEQNLFAEFKISNDKFEIKVIDKAFDDEFLPFNIKNHPCKEKLEVETILNSIISNCFDSISIKKNIINFLQETYGTIPEKPWEEYPNYYTFKTNKSKKWYAIIMDIKQKKLGIDSENIVDAINLKIDPNLIKQLIDNIHYFPAYHMNKKYWITILLDKNTDIVKLKELIDKSYNLVEKNNK